MVFLTFASDVELYILDEPTSGSTRSSRPPSRRRWKRIKAAGGTVLLSQPHARRGRGALDRVSIIRDGHTARTGSLTELRHLTRTTIGSSRRPLTPGWRRCPVYTPREVEGRTRLEVEPDHFDALLAHLAGFGVHALHQRPPTLEELFLATSATRSARAHRRARPERPRTALLTRRTGDEAPLAGTGMLARLVLRRDRIRLGIWLLGTPLLGYALAGSVSGIYPDQAARRGYATTSASSLVPAPSTAPSAAPRSARWWSPRRT